MAFITTGLTNGGVTSHYKFSYDESLAAPGGPEPARTNAVIAACENDYNLMHGWFGGNINVTGLTVQVTTDSDGASWEGSPTSATIQLKAQGAAYSNNPAYLRYLIIAEAVEIFMLAQNAGWFGTHTEGSKGEGLSRFLSGQFLVQNGFLGLGIDADYALAGRWLNSARQDYVNNAPEDNGADAINGCTTLFIYYLFHQVGFSINQIVAAASATLADVYRKLTGEHGDPFPRFKQLLDGRFPSQTSSIVPGPNFDDPWPLGAGAVAYSGVWRTGSDAYALWVNATQDSFVAKWNQLSAQNLRLTALATVPVAAGTSVASVELHGTSTGLGGGQLLALVGEGVTARRLALGDAQGGQAAGLAETGGTLPATDQASVAGDGEGESRLSPVGQTHIVTDGAGEGGGLLSQGGFRERCGRGIHARKPGA